MKLLVTKPCSSHKQKGFTLTELLVAIFIFSLIGLGSWQLLNQANINEKVQTAKSARLIEINRSMNQLTEDIQYLFNRTRRLNEYDIGPGFTGTSNSVEFIRLSQTPFLEQQTSNIRRIRYQLNNPHSYNFAANPANTYIERIQTHALDGLIPESAQTVSLLTDVISIKFTYLDEENIFQQSWPPLLSGASDEESIPLPKAIRLDLELADIGQIYRLIEIGVTDVNPEDEI